MPSLVIICGLPGAGKTTLARQIACDRPAVRFSPDEWLEALAQDLRDDGMRDRVEDLQRVTAGEVLSAGASAVLEWGTWERHKRLSLAQMAHRLGARAELIVLDPPLETLIRRVEKRDKQPPISPDQLREWATEFERVDRQETAGYDSVSFPS